MAIRAIDRAWLSACWLSALAVWAACGGRALAMTDTLTQSGFVVRTWSVADGLPDATVNAIAQTPDGYLWVGTLGGLARFDGTRFTVFNAGNAPALGSGRIQSLSCSRRGVLLIGTVEGGLVRYERGRFVAEPAMPPSTLGPRLLNILEDEAGALWFTKGPGIVGRLADGNYSDVSPEWGDGSYQVRADSSGRFWVSHYQQLYRLLNGKLVLALSIPEGEPHAPSRLGGYWISTGGEVRLWKDGEWIAKAGNPGWGRYLLHGLEDSSGFLWLASRGSGLFRYGTNGTAFQFTTKDGLGSDFVTQMFDDREGNVWVGTDRGGLSCVRPSLFRVYGKAQGLSSDRVCSVAAGRDEIWVATDGDGLNRLRPGVETSVTPVPEFAQIHMGGLNVDELGQVWIGSESRGVFRFNGVGFGRVSGFPGEYLPTYSLLADGAGYLWLGQRGTTELVGVKIGASGPDERIQFPAPAKQVDVRSIARGTDGTLWIGTDGDGLMSFKDGKWQRFGRTNGLGSDIVWSLYAETNDVMWIGTFGGGLSRWKDGKLVACTTRQGLADDVICNITHDQMGRLWFGSHQGLFCVRKSELEDFFEGRSKWVHSVIFGSSDGLPSRECVGGYQSSSCQTSDGRMWFATVKGLVEFDPAKVTLNPFAPQVYIEGMLVDGELHEGLEDALAVVANGGDSVANACLQVPAGHRRFEFRYTSMSFSAPEAVQFQTRLEGLESDWVVAGSSRTAIYGPLAPGRYRFSVRACNRDGVWNETGASIAFELLPRFWQTKWFRFSGVAGLALIIGGTGWLTARRRARRRIEHLEHLHAVEQERIRISRDIHDELGTLLTGITLLSDRSQAHSHEPQKVVQSLRKIGERARTAVQSVDGIVWAINPQNDTLDHLANYLVQFAEEFFHLTRIRCRLDVPVDVPRVPLGTQQRHHLLLAVKEACNNVVRHSGASEVWVRFQTVNGGFWIAVEDNGRGFQSGPEVEGHDGLRNMRQRLAEIGGRMELVSEPDKGTCVKLFAPLDSLKSSS